MHFVPLAINPVSIVMRLTESVAIYPSAVLTAFLCLIAPSSSMGINNASSLRFMMSTLKQSTRATPPIQPALHSLPRLRSLRPCPVTGIIPRQAEGHHSPSHRFMYLAVMDPAIGKAMIARYCPVCRKIPLHVTALHACKTAFLSESGHHGDINKICAI